MALKKLLLLLYIIFTGCSTGWSHSYDQAVPNLTVIGTGKTIVITQDRRPDVRAGKVQPQIVATVHSLFSSPWQATTTSGLALAQDLSTAACLALNKQGFACSPLTCGNNDLELEVRYQMHQLKPQRAIVISIDQWDAQVNFSTTINYNITLKVLDKNGYTLATARTRGEDTLRFETFLNPAENASLVAPEIFKRVLESLFNDSKVQRQLEFLPIKTVEAEEANGRNENHLR